MDVGEHIEAWSYTASVKVEKNMALTCSKAAETHAQYNNVVTTFHDIQNVGLDVENVIGSQPVEHGYSRPASHSSQRRRLMESEAAKIAKWKKLDENMNV